MNNNPDIQQHLKSFAEAFVLDSRKQKWLHLLSERPDNILSQSSKLFNYLDHNFIVQNDSLTNVASHDELGVYYDFKSEPEIISFKAALERSKSNDSIFSMQPGKLVIYLFHDGWNFVCRK
ncbi:MAG TPA: hypothetical protein VIQ03_02960 [Gammaproteobacteria bacterium]